MVYALRYIVATCGAALLGLAATLPVFAMGLVVPATVVLSLALLAGALVSAVVAGWVCYVGVRDRTAGCRPWWVSRWRRRWFWRR